MLKWHAKVLPKYIGDLHLDNPDAKGIYESLSSIMAGDHHHQGQYLLVLQIRRSTLFVIYMEKIYTGLDLLHTLNYLGLCL